MWRLARTCARPPSRTASQRAWASTRKKKSTSLFEDDVSYDLPHPPQTPPQATRRPKRLPVILISFAAGFSIYFFLDDPEIIPPLPVKPSISPSQYIPTKLVSSDVSGLNTKLLKIAAPPHLIPSKGSHGSHGVAEPVWSIYIKDDDIQVERAYTPLNGVDADGNMSFWIKKYPKGEVGRWLHSKDPGDRIEVRGPVKTWPWKEDDWDEIVMISGGTGITPFVQLFNNIIKKSPSSNTRFTLLHSSRLPSELPPPYILDPMVTFATDRPDKFKLHIFVDEEEETGLPCTVVTRRTGRITEGALKTCLGMDKQPTSWWNKLLYKPAAEEPSRRILFLVCGPEPMIGTIAGPFGRNLSQGPVGGILGNMGYQSTEVYKL